MPTHCVQCGCETLKRVKQVSKVLAVTKTGKSAKKQSGNVYKCGNCHWGTTIWQGQGNSRVAGRAIKRGSIYE